MTEISNYQNSNFKSEDIEKYNNKLQEYDYG